MTGWRPGAGGSVTASIPSAALAWVRHENLLDEGMQVVSDLNLCRTYVREVTTKSGKTANGRTWTLYIVKFEDAREATTFDAALGDDFFPDADFTREDARVFVRRGIHGLAAVERQALADGPLQAVFDLVELAFAFTQALQRQAEHSPVGNRGETMRMW